MTDDTRALIRHLYFVAQVPLHAIAERLGLSVPAVRRALVLPGGQNGRQEPAPLATALTAGSGNGHPPSAINLHGAAPIRRATQRHR